jgi:hypothetical protein
VSTIESPNIITAGMVSFVGIFITPLVLQKITHNIRMFNNNFMVEEEEGGGGGVMLLSICVKGKYKGGSTKAI